LQPANLARWLDRLFAERRRDHNMLTVRKIMAPRNAYGWHAGIVAGSKPAPPKGG
jgi:hypothetical protein